METRSVNKVVGYVRAVTLQIPIGGIITRRLADSNLSTTYALKFCNNWFRTSAAIKLADEMFCDILYKRLWTERYNLTSVGAIG